MRENKVKKQGVERRLTRRGGITRISLMRHILCEKERHAFSTIQMHIFPVNSDFKEICFDLYIVSDDWL